MSSERQLDNWLYRRLEEASARVNNWSDAQKRSINYGLVTDAITTISPTTSGGDAASDSNTTPSEAKKQ